MSSSLVVSNYRAKPKMLMSASSEFVALAREQMALLAQGLGASLSIVYLTQELVEAQVKEAKLVPLLTYPETATLAQQEIATGDLRAFDSITVENDTTNLRKNRLSSSLNQKLLAPGEDLPVLSSDFASEKAIPSNSHSATDKFLLNPNQIVLPLIHEGMMIGVLVTTRDDRAWNEQERTQIERVAQSLAIACLLDQKRAWLQQQLHSSQILQEKQQDLLDTLLHQFRNPLTALRTFGKLLIKRLQPGDKNRDVASSIVRESDRLQELLQKFEEVIDYTSGDLASLRATNKLLVEASSPKQPKPTLLLPGSDEAEVDCYITDILQPLLENANAIATERYLQLIIEIPTQLSVIRANTKALREVLSNIIDNALKYTPERGKILVQAGLEKGSMQGVAISDTGPGIPQQDLEHIGERHYRGVQAQTEIPGTGLGIAIAKQLIEQMQGEIQVISPALDSRIKSNQTPGTTFIIWLQTGN